MQRTSVSDVALNVWVWLLGTAALPLVPLYARESAFKLLQPGATIPTR